ncbi:flagellar basal body P-ring formation chaperone FlgA [Enterovirga rhinocerotis]|uniref:Flagella basal body P-ring formation protein FlgA n=1 Tax=Enterovirga rhinocerotis TaxID=1339210 RepID=A0A4R7BT28_9HYPH|nr:flagellar basal body P-ring formation chaperone FlgA [Enterovirga rhinocerotis]TDR88904.1 flagella basal body P-ring formation protein FlgA [Enterovirga rhinocerotis]
MTTVLTRPLVSLATVAALLSAGAAFAAGPMLRGDITASADTLTVGDLIENAPPALADAPLFRAPALGATGTIQTRRIQAAAEALGIAIQSGGRVQILVTRAARRIGPDEIEAAIRKRLAAEHGLDPASTGIVLDGPAPVLAAPPTLTGEAIASEIAFDRRTRRVFASVWLGPSPAERRAQIRIGGSVVDLIEVAVATRPLERGQELKAGDITIERRPRDTIGADAQHDGGPLAGRIVRRTAAAGTVLRPADFAKPELVGRGDVVTAVYEAPGVALALRVRATESGSLGETIAVVNPHSKKTLQAIVTGPGRVSVGPAAPGRVASAARTTP